MLAFLALDCQGDVGSGVGVTMRRRRLSVYSVAGIPVHARESVAVKIDGKATELTRLMGADASWRAS